MKSLYQFILITAFMQLSFNTAMAQQPINAVIAGDFADPSIIRKGNQYYAVGTSSEWAPHFPIFTSQNLVDWKQAGYVFDKAPEWTSGSFWAPEYYFHNNTYFIYYTARRKKDNVSYIGVASSAYPDKGFTDHGVIVEYGTEAIDGFVFNDNGQLYITFKAYGLDKRPIEILGSKLSADGLHLEGKVFSMLKDDKRMGMEGESILKKDDYYYLFYAAGNCCGIKCDYNVRIARSKTFTGPYEEYAGNPVLQENADWKCSGHGTFVHTAHNKYYYLYHAYNKQSGVVTGRQALLAELVWPEKNGWPAFKSPVAAKANTGITDLFNAKKIAGYWQWDFRNAAPIARQFNGNLHLSGTAKATNKAGIVLTVRPTALNFEATTTVINNNTALKGLAYYGDANAAAGIGVADNRVQLWIVKDTSRTILFGADIIASKPVELKISPMPDHSCHFFYRQGQDAWKELAADQKITIDFLPQWDRAPRIGLHYKGEAAKDAVFASFELKYK